MGLLDTYTALRARSTGLAGKWNFAVDRRLFRIHSVESVGSLVMGRELIAIQYVRGLAAILVVFYHLQPQFNRLGFTQTIPTGLSGGVDIFFVISGLIMWITTCDRRISPLTFLNHRLVRIVPLYWLTTTVMVAVMVVAPTVLQTARFDLSHIVASYAFLAWPHPTTGFMEPVVLPGWTLNYEMFFYLAFSGLLLIRRSSRLLVAILFFAILPILGVIFRQGIQPGTSMFGQAEFYTSSIMLEFVFGMGLGEIYARTRLLEAIPPRYGWLVVIVGLALLVSVTELFPSSPRAVSCGIPAVLLVGGALSLDSVGGVRRHWLPLLAGNASYSLYLMHPFVLSAMSQIWRKLAIGHSAAVLSLFVFLSVALCLVTAALSYRLVESPLIAFFRKRRK